MIANEVIIIGGDHHNTLSVIRCFGRKNISSITIIHTNENNINRIKCSKTRYSKNKCCCVPDEEHEILKFLLSYSNSEKKRYIFPCSDLAAYTLDKNRKVLKQWYYIPGFLDENITIIDLMDKLNQCKLCEELSIATPFTMKFNFGESLPEQIKYPCVLKPVVSATGLKSDIVKVDSYTDLVSAISDLKKKGYDSILIQEYIKYTMQYLACGCLLPNSQLKCGTIFKKQRESKNGSTGLGVVTREKDVLCQNEKILNYLQDHNYWGCYDIEYFRFGDKVLLNEINLRHSGAGCILIDNGIPIPYYWYKDKEEKLKINKRELEPEIKFISEIDDLYNVAIKKISIFKWLYDCLRINSHTIYSNDDKIGSFNFYKSFFILMIRRIFTRGR